MKKMFFFLMIVAFVATSNLFAGDFFIAKQSYDGTMVLGWDHMEEFYLTEIVTNVNGDFFSIGIGPMMTFGCVDFNAPLLFSLTKTGLSEEFDLAPRFDITVGSFLLQSWSDIIFSTEYLNSWSADNRILREFGAHKIGINVLISSEDDFSITAAGLIDQYRITDIFTICTFFGATSDQQTSAWVKIKFFIP